MDVSKFLADFISPAEHEEIRIAMGGLHNTFAKTPVTYYLNVGTFDRFQEGRKAESTYTEYNLMAMVEYGMLRNDEFVVITDGQTDSSLLRVMFNVDHLDSMGLWDNTANTAKFNGTGKDKLVTKGKEWRITELGNGDPMEDRSLIYMIFCEPATRIAK